MNSGWFALGGALIGIIGSYFTNKTHDANESKKQYRASRERQLNKVIELLADFSTLANQAYRGNGAVLLLLAEGQGRIVKNDINKEIIDLRAKYVDNMSRTHEELIIRLFDDSKITKQVKYDSSMLLNACLEQHKQVSEEKLEELRLTFLKASDAYVAKEWSNINPEPTEGNS